MMIRSAMMLAGASAVFGFAVASDASIAIPNDPFLGKQIQMTSAANSATINPLINTPDMSLSTYNGAIFQNNSAFELLWIAGAPISGSPTFETAPISSDGIQSIRIWTRHASTNVDDWLTMPIELEVRYTNATSGSNWGNHLLVSPTNWRDKWTEEALPRTTGLTTYNDPNPGQKFQSPTGAQKWTLDSTVFTNKLDGEETLRWYYADFEVDIPATATSVVLSFGQGGQDGPYDPAFGPNFSGTRIGAVQALVAVPEPTSLGLAGLAALGLLARRRASMN